jgi:benzoyl-CoA reductase/2-hydroxyglutaryl-CoA dehydratase subunit BcrC/BadD/HgdB
MNAYVPQELFLAAGYTPVLLLHGRQGRGLAQRHLPGFTCWVVRSALDRALAGDLAGWSGVAFAHTCDALQALADLWPRAVPGIRLFCVAMPDHLEAAGTRAYLMADLARVRGVLEEAAGRSLDDDALRESISLANRTRSLLQRFLAATDRLPAPAVDATLRAAFIMPRDTYNGLLEELLEGLFPAGSAGSDQAVGARLVLVGPELADPVLYQVIGDAGGRIVGDLLDLGQRHFAGIVAETTEPLVALADHALALLPTPTKYHPERRRDSELLEMVRSRKAEGVIFARQKFCEPHGFDLITLRSALDEAAVPSLVIELEQTTNVGQMRTRVEAFMEMIG